MASIVYFLPDTDAGVSRMVYNLLKYRPESDHNYIVVLMFMLESGKSSRIKEPFHNAQTIKFEYNPLDNLYSIYKRMAGLVEPGDIIVGNDGYEIRMVTALKLKNPVVYIIHGDFTYYYLIAKLNQSVIDVFIAISKKICQQLKTDLQDENKEKVNLIYYPSAALDNNTADFSKEDGFKIVFAGTLNERKGAHLLWDIYIKLFKTIPNFALEIIGDGELKEKLDEQFKDAANVTITGWQTNDYILERLAESHVFLFPSFLEGLPNVLIEALSRGAVPVSSDLPSGVRDIIENEKNGLLAETGNAEAFARAIKYLYNNPLHLKAMREYGKEILNKFEPWEQSKVYQDTIVALAKKSGELPERQFPVYPMGRWLNKPWIPNLVVKLVRTVVKHPKL